MVTPNLTAALAGVLARLSIIANATTGRANFLSISTTSNSLDARSGVVTVRDCQRRRVGLFLAQRKYRVDSGCFSCGKVPGQKRRSHQDRGGAYKRQRIVGSGSEQEGFHEFG